MVTLQSRSMRVKCCSDGELPSGRKEADGFLRCMLRIPLKNSDYFTVLLSVLSQR